MIKSCKDCQERHIGCHSECEKYISERAEYDREKSERYSVWCRENEANEAKKLGIKRMKRGKRK